MSATKKSSKSKIRCVYVCGPITKGNMTDNIGRGIKAGAELMAAGFVPYIPHLDFMAAIMCPNEFSYEAILTADLEWISRCDAILRLPGESPGGNREVAYAKKIGVPVFYTLKDLVEASDD